MPKIESKTARDKLPARRDPYWQRIAPGLFVGYRVSLLGGDGTWRGRWRDESGQHYRKIASHEFTPDKIGSDTKFRQAELIVREWHSALEQGVVPQRLTVGEVALQYLQSKTMLPLEQIKSTKHTDLSRDDRNIKKALSVFERLVIDDEIGKVHLDRLRSDWLTAWMRRLVEDIDPSADDELRAGKNTANRTWASLRAALNWAFAQRLVASDNAWRAVKRFSSVDGVRDYIPTRAEIERFYTFASPEVITVCEFLRLTGCRPGEAYQVTVDSIKGNSLQIGADTKTGRRSVPLSSEASAFIAKLSEGKIKKAYLLTREDGQPWVGAEFSKRFRAAREAAGFGFEFVPYSFRHLWITNACQVMEVLAVAQTAGTSVDMIQKHYAKLQPGRVTAALDNLATIRAREAL